MSLILEALKKSEQQRRLGEAPTLGSPVVSVRRRRSLLPLFAVAIVAALAVGWWLSRSSGSGPTPIAPTSPSVAKTAAPPPKADTTAATATPPTAHAEHRPLPRHEPPATSGYTPPAAMTNLATSAPSRPAAAPGKAPAAAAPAVAEAGTTKQPAAAPKSPPVAAKEPATVASAKPAQPPAPATPKPAPQQPALPTLWELPYSTRKEIPAIELTMHVYASDPAQRFVIIKGDRHVEGDDLGDGLELKQIRADGMVLDYHGQDFVYPRDGR